MNIINIEPNDILKLSYLQDDTPEAIKKRERKKQIQLLREKRERNELEQKRIKFYNQYPQYKLHQDFNFKVP